MSWQRDLSSCPPSALLGGRPSFLRLRSDSLLLLQRLLSPGRKEHVLDDLGVLLFLESHGLLVELVLSEPWRLITRKAIEPLLIDFLLLLDLVGELCLGHAVLPLLRGLFEAQPLLLETQQTHILVVLLGMLLDLRDGNGLHLLLLMLEHFLGRAQQHRRRGLLPSASPPTQGGTRLLAAGSWFRKATFARQQARSRTSLSFCTSLITLLPSEFSCLSASRLRRSSSKRCWISCLRPNLSCISASCSCRLRSSSSSANCCPSCCCFSSLLRTNCCFCLCSLWINSCAFS